MAKETFHNLCQSTSSIHCYRDVSNEETSQMTKPIDNKNDRLSILSHYAHNYGSIHCKPFDKAASVHLPPLAADSDIAAEPLQDSLFNDFFSVPFLPTEKPKFTFIDLFAGIGGFRMAMQRLGGKCVFSSEWDEQAKRTYFANYGEYPTMVNIHSATSQKKKQRHSSPTISTFCAQDFHVKPFRWLANGSVLRKPEALCFLM